MSKKSWDDEGVSPEKLKGRASQKGKKFSSEGARYILPNVPMYVPGDGDNSIRIVQPLEVKSLGYYGMDVHFHRNVGDMGGYFLCLKRMYSKPCPICVLQTSELWDTDRDLAKSYYPDWRILMWVLDLKETDPEKEGMVLLWSAPRTLAEEILGQSHKAETEVYIDVSHPTKGRGVFFKRSGQGVQTEYTGVQIGDKVMSLPDEILDDMMEFNDTLIIPTYDEVKAAQEGGDFDPGEGGSDSPLEESPVESPGKFKGWDRAKLKAYIAEKDYPIKPRKDWEDRDIIDAIRACEGSDDTGPDDKPVCFGSSEDYSELDSCDSCLYYAECGIESGIVKSNVTIPDQGEEKEPETSSEADGVNKKLEEAIKRRRAQSK